MFPSSRRTRGRCTDHMTESRDPEAASDSKPGIQGPTFVGRKSYLSAAKPRGQGSPCPLGISMSPPFPAPGKPIVEHLSSLHPQSRSPWLRIKELEKLQENRSNTHHQQGLPLEFPVDCFKQHHTHANHRCVSASAVSFSVPLGVSLSRTISPVKRLGYCSGSKP